MQERSERGWSGVFVPVHREGLPPARQRGAVIPEPPGDAPGRRLCFGDGAEEGLASVRASSNERAPSIGLVLQRQQRNRPVVGCSAPARILRNRRPCFDEHPHTARMERREGSAPRTVDACCRGPPIANRRPARLSGRRALTAQSRRLKPTKAYSRRRPWSSDGSPSRVARSPSHETELSRGNTRSNDADSPGSRSTMGSVGTSPFVKRHSTTPSNALYGSDSRS